jgi:hypothetical protein
MASANAVWKAGLPLGCPDADQRECRKQAPRGRIGDQLAQERLCVDGFVQQRLQLLHVEEHECVAVEIGRGIGPAHLDEMRGVRRQCRLQVGSGLLGDLRCGAIHHRHQQVVGLRKVAVHRRVPLPPRQAGREQVVGVGGHAKPGRGEPATGDGQHQTGEKHEPRAAADGVDERGKQALQHHARRDSRSGRPGPSPRDHKRDHKSGQLL